MCDGRPVIKGTRIPVDVVLDHLAENESWDEILRGYPELTKTDIQAAIRFAQTGLLLSQFTELTAA